MKMTRTILALATALLAAISLAQPRQGGGMRMGMGGGMMAPSYMLVNRLDVQDDLKLTSDQKSKLTAMREEMQEKMRAVFQEARGDRDAMQKAMTKMNDENQKQVNSILTPDQVKRLGEIRVQMAGSLVIMDPELGKTLGVTEAQKAKVQELMQRQRDANQSLMEKARNGEVTREQAFESMRKNGDALKVEVEKLLSQTQKAKIKEMSGATFVMKDEPGMGFGGFGGGRRGGGGN